MANVPFSIRHATPDDAVAIAEVHVASWRAAYRGLLPDAVLANLEVGPRVSDARTQATRPDRTVLVAERDGRIVGFGSCGATRDLDAASATGEVFTIYLLPEAFGLGIGRELFGRLSEALERRGFERGSLWVLETNERGRRFYEAAGWRPDGATKVDTISGAELREVRYVRDLKAHARSGELE